MKPTKPQPITRTFKLDRLYHQFLKPKGIDTDKLHFFVTKLYEAQFIVLFHEGTSPDVERYAETEKLTSRLHRDELFKIIEGLKA